MTTPKKIKRVPIKFFATNVGKTLLEVSAETGIDLATLSKLNTGKLAFLKIEYIQPLCKALHIRPSELFNQFVEAVESVSTPPLEKNKSETGN